MYDIVYVNDDIYFTHLKDEFVNDYLRWINDERIYKFLGGKGNLTLEDEMNYINENKEKHVFSIIDKHTGILVGNVGLNNGGDNEIGIFIGVEYQNDGYGKKALNLFCDYCFNVLGFDYITLCVFSNNYRAIHVYKTLGFVEYKVVEDIETLFDEKVDDIYMKKLK